MRTDEKLTNAATFTVLKEDHTLGNLLRMYGPVLKHRSAYNNSDLGLGNCMKTRT